MSDETKTETMEPTAPKIEFVTKKGRFKDVPLEWPLLVDGVELKKVVVRRLKGAEVADLQEKMQGDGVGEKELLGAFVDQSVNVLDSLDQDDLAAVKEAVFDFLPLTVRKMLEALAEQQGLHIGEPSLPTSPTPSNGASETS